MSDAQFWVTIIYAIANAIVLVYTATKTRQTHQQVTPPSNGRTLGQLMESNINATHVAAVESTRVRQELLPNRPAPVPPIPESPPDASPT